MKKINEKELEQLIKDKTTFILDFYVEWCSPCKILEPILEKIDEDYKNVMDVYKIDGSLYPDLSKKFNVLGVPSILFFKNGELKDKIVGFSDEQHIRETIDHILIHG